MSWFPRTRRGCGSSRRFLDNHLLSIDNGRRKPNKQRFALSICRLAAALTLLPAFAQAALACSPRAPLVVIEAQIDKTLFSQPTSCLDRNCLFVFERNEYGFVVEAKGAEGRGATIGSGDKNGEEIRFTYFWASAARRGPSLPEAAFGEALDRLIQNDITDIQPVFLPESESWAKNHKGYFLGGNLVFTPYEQDKESKLLEEKNQLLDCRYSEYKRVGNWLVANSTGRDYCQLSEHLPSCPFPVVAYSQFFAFLLSDVNRTTAPYLAVWSALIVAMGLFARYLFRRKELWFFLKPRVPTVVITGLLGVVLFVFLSGTEALWWYLAVIYGSASLVGYIGSKLGASPKAG